PKIKTGQNIDFTLINLPGKNYTAKIYSVGTAFENETKTISVHAEITGEKTGLIEGMNVTGLINIGENISTAVLSSAIVADSGEDYIFIQKEDSSHQRQVNKDGQGLFTFEKIRVKKGITTGGYTEISPLEEIPANAKVVTNGAFYLMAILTNAGEE
ncbi:MAG TPA: efflux RND transporter periplasmic adaptor subunit, partial [Chitinophagaceae bacterium]|nr:efflux RND transporter periplasmic adaptor subunit [Chitinophagaceae bacterium]